MSIEITRPIRTFDESQNSISHWVAGNNPIIYTFKFPVLPDSMARAYVTISVNEFGSDAKLGELLYKPRFSSKPTSEQGYEATVVCNIQPVVKPYLKQEFNLLTSTTINQRDDKSTIKVYIKYSFDQKEYFSDIQYPIYVTSSVKQIGDSLGQSLGHYTCFGTDNQTKAKFLSAFNQPRIYQGYNCNTVSFLYSEKITGVEIRKIEVEKDINMNIIRTTSTPLDSSQAYYMNHLKFKNEYEPQVKYVECWLETGSMEDSNYVNINYVTEDFV